MKIIGHRGAKGLAPENTLASLQKALEHHVDEVEFDVRVCKDQTVILLHDPFLTDPAGNKLEITEHTLEGLMPHKPDLTTLKTVFSSLPRETRLVIEVKPHEKIEPIIAVLNAAKKDGWNLHQLHIASFDQKALRQIHKSLPEIGIVINESWSGVRASMRARELHTKRITMRSTWLWSGFIRGMRRQGYQLSTYTLNDAQKARRWARYGLYGVVTDYPDLFV